ncbi:poly polymerase and DNA-ligase Zn-finger region-domain-containing protein [Aspergillus novoparasiticus]|uniref:Poly polymerase and DNA-ligase Zn-finger region-domain-containing protein n=1 Tax=Aspergillus novoparasiticus TaxID=986946 RepID=A0A5N6F2M8_9EURO|nr:poly polymerase and DNA-ligase Zn-finger region-domain-containing protein [Aspergillus novoparasiticus]
MPSYRLEQASTGRAGCQNKECKDEKVKIAKGELRLGTWVDTERIQAFFWRHWGCVTPRIIASLNENLGDGDEKDYEQLDGFEDLTPENQEKVKKALEQGHVDDDEWKGDVEMNRPGKNGFRVRGSKKKAAAPEESEAEEKSPEPKTKKRGRQSIKDEAEDQAEETPETKKPKRGARGKRASEGDKATKEEADDETATPAKPKATRRGRASKNDTEDKKSPEAPAKAAKPTTRRQRKSIVKDEEAEPVVEEPAEEKPAEEKPKRGRRKKTA